jgi:hypothetical protein
MTESELIEKVTTVLRKIIISQITSDLTTWREEEEIGPAYTKEELDKFFELNEEKINLVISLMIADYKRDDELEDLLEPYGDWIREYLYEYVYVPGMTNIVENEDSDNE